MEPNINSGYNSFDSNSVHILDWNVFDCVNNSDFKLFNQTITQDPRAKDLGVQSLSQVFAIIYYIADDSGISEDHVCFEMIQKIIALMNLKVFPSSVQIMSPVS